MNFPVFASLPRFLVVSLMALPVSAAFGWGAEGHQAIARVAVEELAKINPAAAAKVKEILEGESVEEAAIWPDDVRVSANATYSGRFAETEEGKAFNAAHPGNPTWHYVDLPLDVTSYAQDKRFTNDSDVVATTLKCAEVLEGKSQFMTKHQALRWLLHLVGDMHQPLHVAVGFFRFAPDGQATLITNPNEAAQADVVKDNGGNKLLLDKKLNLHRYFDEKLVEQVAPDVDQLAAVLRRELARIPASTGAWRAWPPQWAEESVVASRVVYAGLLFSKRYPREGNFWSVYVNFKPGSKETYKDLVENRLVGATRHLTDLLNAIQWQ